MKRILFVCLGNICRSPMAEGVFKSLIEKDGLNSCFEVDSAGTGAYHVGELPDYRMRETAMSHGIRLTSRARQFVVSDFDEFDHILVMDNSNYRNVISLARSEEDKKKVVLFRAFDDLQSSSAVEDPYYGGAAGFEDCYQVVLQTSKNLLIHLGVETRNS